MVFFKYYEIQCLTKFSLTDHPQTDILVDSLFIMPFLKNSLVVEFDCETHRVYRSTKLIII